MTRIDATTLYAPDLPSPELRLAAEIVLAAAKALAGGLAGPDASRYLLAADRISTALESPRANRRRLLMASPAVDEMSGQTRTLIEMIEGDPGDETYRLRLAKLLFRALDWRPESFPMPPS